MSATETNSNQESEVTENSQENQENSQIESSSSSEENVENVPYEKYKKTAQDMLKYKHELRNVKSELEKIQQQQKEAQTKALKENEEYKTLSEKLEEENRRLNETLEQEKQRIQSQNKMSAVLSNLDSGFKKPEYRNFIKLDNIELDEHGQPSQEAVKAEVERIKMEHPELLKLKQATPAPSTAPQVGIPEQPKTRQELVREIGAGIAKYKQSVK